MTQKWSVTNMLPSALDFVVFFTLIFSKINLHKIEKELYNSNHQI